MFIINYFVEIYLQNLQITSPHKIKIKDIHYWIDFLSTKTQPAPIP